MKILRLSLNNLASLAGTHHIHFEDDPLAHAGLIAITGKTGAGKSTLLDAMCLALYNEVPRLRGAAGSLTDVGGQEISIKDSKNILRRGTTSGFAELEFIALDGKRYQARWEIRRARNKIDGNLKVERAITCIDDQVLLNHKISEATPIIEKLIGLSFEQFTRAVLLAQSEVGAFLKAKDNERADLLEYLTNSHIFSLVSIKAAEKHSQIKQQRLLLENQIGNIELLSAEEIEQLQHQQSAAALQLQNLQQAEKLLENEKKWHLDRDRIYAEVHGKKEIYDVQLDAVHKLATQQQLLEQLDQFQSIREQYVQQRNLEPKKIAIQQQQIAFKIDFDQIQQQLSNEQSKLNTLKDQQNQFNHHYTNIRPHLEAGLKLDHEIETVSQQYKKINAEYTQFNIQRIQPLETELQHQTTHFQTTQTKLLQVQQQLSSSHFLNVFDQEPQSILQRLDEYSTRYETLKNNNANALQWNPVELEQRIFTCNEKLKSWVAEYSSLEQLEQERLNLQHRHNQIHKQQYQLNHIHQQVEDMIEQVSHAKQLDTELQSKKLQLEAEQKDSTQLKTKLESEQLAYQQLEQILNQQRLIHTQSVQELRDQLKPNEPCMVCGSHEHPFSQKHALLEQDLEQLQDQQLNQAREKIDALSLNHQQKLIDISKLEIHLEQLQKSLDQSNQQSDVFIKNTLITLNDLGLSLSEMFNLEQIKEALTSHLDSLRTQLDQSQHKENHFIELIQQWRTTSKDLQQYQSIQRELADLAQLIAPIQTHLPDHLKNEAAISWSNQIKQQLQQRIQLLENQQRYASDLQTQQQQLDKIQFQLQTEQKQFEKIANEVAQLIETGKNLRQQLLDLTQLYADQTYRVAAEWRNKLELQSSELQHHIQDQQLLTTQAEQQLHQGNLKLQSFTTQLKELEHQLSNAQQATLDWQMRHPQVTHAMIEEYLMIDLASHQAMRRDLNNQKQLLENAKTQWQLLEEQFQAHLKLKPEHELDDIEKRLELTHHNKLEQQNQLNELDTKLRIHANNQANFAKYQHQIEQIKAEEYRWGRIYDLIGHKEGTKFQKIAQEHHLDILVEYANQQLQPLAPRYQLHRVPNSLSLAIIDLDMNSEVRPVLSLSGGETFLVSLALALAIANMAAGSMKLETLFIDEGFGTLDPASLHMVMNALDHLQSQGRKVVLISHIQEMHERIPVQIQVKSVGAGASKIEVVS